MIELVIFISGAIGGFAAAVCVWPWIRIQAIGAAAEIVRLRAQARALEDLIKGAL